MKILGVNITWQFVAGVIVATLIANIFIRLLHRVDAPLDATLGED